MTNVNSRRSKIALGPQEIIILVNALSHFQYCRMQPIVVPGSEHAERIKNLGAKLSGALTEGKIKGNRSAKRYERPIEPNTENGQAVQ